MPAYTGGAFEILFITTAGESNNQFLDTKNDDGLF